VPPIQILTQNGKIKILLSEFHLRTKLTALLFSNLASSPETKLDTQTFEILKSTNLNFIS
jgi:hypothetical protein